MAGCLAGREEQSFLRARAPRWSALHRCAIGVVGIFAMMLARDASAVTHIWFVATPTSLNANALQPGAIGQGTVLTCLNDFPSESCSWRVEVHFQNDAGDEPIVGWATDLYMRETQPGKTSIDPVSLIYAPGIFPNHSGSVQYGAGPLLEKNANGYDLGSGASQGTLASFTLRTTGTIVQFDHLYAVAGDREWLNANFEYPDMQAGSNPIVPQGGGAGTDLGNVITILKNEPEPGTFVLLALGSSILVGRRRR